MNWYVVLVRTGDEDIIKKILHQKFDTSTLQCIVPKRKVPERVKGVIYDSLKILFPGYLFIKTRMDFSKYHEIRKMPKIYNLLNYRNNKDKNMTSTKSGRNQQKLKLVKQDDKSNEELFFKKVPDEEIEILLQLIDKNDIIDYSQVFLQDSTVFVQSGPLKGKEVIIKKIDKHKKRAKIIIKFMDYDNLIEVGIEILSHKFEKD